MKPWIKRSLFTLFGASVLIGGLSACSSHPRWGHGPMDETQMTEMRGKMVERISSKLSLDATQRQKLDALADALQAQRRALKGEGGQPREAFQSLMSGSTFDRERARSLLTEKTQTLQQGGPAVIDAMGDFFDSLKPEQQAQVREMMQRGRGGWGHHRG